MPASHLSNFENLENKILDWALVRGIGMPGMENTVAQLAKVLEEAHEVEEAIATSEDKATIQMEIGDLLVTIILLCNTLKTTSTECLEMAERKIRNRKGKTVNGIFYKEGDEPPQE
jgi:NTP pyrophosphatase (non-canonical NTP hydrolase)